MPYGDIPTPISLGYEGVNPPITIQDEPLYSDEYLQEKALKYNFTLGEHSPGMPNLLQTARSGLLKSIARNVVDQDKLEDMKARNQLLQSLADNNKGQPLAPEMYDFVTSLTSSELEEAQTDPLWDANAVYAKKVVNEQLNSEPYPWEEAFASSQKEEDTQRKMDAAETHIAWRETLYDVLSELESDMESKSFVGKGYEYAEQWLVPFASYFNQRNTVEGSNVGSIALGNNKEEQYRRLWALPLKERQKALRKYTDIIAEDNKLDAIEFVRGALEYGRQHKHLDNLFFGLEVATSIPLATAGKLIKGGAKAVKGGSTVIEKESTGVVDALTRGSDEKQAEMTARKIKSRGTPVAEVKDKRVVSKEPIAAKDPGRPSDSRYVNSAGVKLTVRQVENTVQMNKQYIRNIEFTLKDKGEAVRDPEKVKHLTNQLALLKKDVAEKEAWLKSTSENTSVVKDKGVYTELWKKVQKGDTTVDGKPSPFLKAAQSEFIAGRLATPEALEKFAKAGPNPDYKVETALGDLVQATDPSNPNIISDTLAATGREAEGAAVKAQKMAAVENSPEPPASTRGLVERDSLTPSMYDVQTQKLPEPHITKITNEMAHRINEAMKKVGAKLDEAVFASKSVATRFSSEEMLQQARKVAQDDFARLYPKVGDAVLDVSMRTPDQTLGNVVAVYTTMGKTDKTLFKKPVHANNYAKRHYNLRDGSFDVVQIGNKYAIRVETVADESKLSDFLIPTTGENSTPLSTANTFIGYLRTQDDLISQTSIENRKAITHAYSMLQREVKEVADLIANVGRVPGRMTRFERVLQDGLNSKRMVQHTDEWTGETKEIEVVGKEWNMAGFERRYMELNNGKMPSESEILAYETYKRLLKFDLAIRNLDLYRDKAILGVTEWRFRGLRVNEKGELVKGWSNTFDGKLLDDLPYDHPENTYVAIPSETDAFAEVFPVKKLSQNNRDYIKKKQDEGYRLIEVANPNENPLENMLKTNYSINFVLVKESQASPLKLAQLPRTQGGHRIPNEGWFVKQGRLEKPKHTRIGRDGKPEEVEADEVFYRGDITIAGVHSEAKAKEMIPLLEKARKLFNEGNRKAFDEWVEKYLPREPGFLWNDFETKVLDPSQAFHVTKSGQGVNDTEGFRNAVKSIPNFVDSVDSSFNLYRRINKKFAGEKSPDLLSFSKAGTSEGNPVLRFKTARYIDPLKAMQTSMSSLMRNRAFSDYIIHSTNSWVEEFGDLLKVEGGMETLRANPLHYLHNPSWIDKPVQRDRLAAAKNARLAITNLLGTTSDLKNNVDWLKGKIVDTVYNKVGDKASEFVSDRLLPTTNDPLAYVRSAAFHMKLGLLNPVQVIVQGQTLFHMAAITGNPLRAGSSFIGSGFMQMLLHTDSPKIIDHVAGLASKAGWGSKADFLESYEVFKKTGLRYVEGEHGWVNDVLDPNMFENAGTKFLDKGTLFFKGIERYMRLGSWNIAYKEWKAANPGKALTKQSDIRKVLARQNLLANNMTNDSAANLQKGIFSLSTQFFGYQMRMLDQILGKRLTSAEKMRVLGTYSMLYGVPIGTGVGLATPWYGDIMEYAERNGIKTDEGASQLFFQGALSFLTEYALGDEYNPGKRYGPGGFEFVKNLLDDGFGQDGLITLMGASTGILMDAARWSQPALTGLWSATMDDEQDALPLETQDFVDAFRSISTVNNAVKAYQAIYFNSYFTRDGKKVATVNEIDALAIGLFGLTPSSIDTMYRQMDFIKERNDAQDSFKKEYVKNMRRALRAPDKATRALYLKRARIMAQSADIDTRESARWFQEALKGDEQLILDIDKEYRELIGKQETLK